MPGPTGLSQADRLVRYKQLAYGYLAVLNSLDLTCQKFERCSLKQSEGLRSRLVDLVMLMTKSHKAVSLGW